MQFDKTKIVIVLIGCFLGASIVVFMLKRDGNLVLKDKPTDKAGKNQLHESSTQQQPEERSTEALKTLETYPQTQSYNIEDLEALSGDLLEGDIGDVMDMEWSSREITSDFSDRNKVSEEVRQFTIVSDISVSEEQLNQLRNCVTEMIFNNGNNDYDSYLDFLKKSGEKVDESLYKNLRITWILKGVPEEEVPTDPWKLLSEDLKKDKEKIHIKSMWKGLVLEGSEIKIFEAQTSKLPIGRELRKLRGAIKTYRDLTAPPISLDEMLKAKGKVIMADVQVFIAHDDSMGGVVWPYIIRYWFDPINNSWRVHRVALFKNRHKSCLLLYVLS